MHIHRCRWATGYGHLGDCRAVSYDPVEQYSRGPWQCCQPTSIPWYWSVSVRTSPIGRDSVWWSSLPWWTFRTGHQLVAHPIDDRSARDTGIHCDNSILIRTENLIATADKNTYVAWWWHASTASVFDARCIRWALPNTHIESSACVMCCGFCRMILWDGFESSMITIRLVSFPSATNYTYINSVSLIDGLIHSWHV